MGVSYKGGAPYYRCITENIPSITKLFEYDNGYFGEKGNGNRVRVIYDDDPAAIGKKLYDEIAFGGIEKGLPNGKGKITYMADGSIITFRPTTKSDDYPGVDINVLKSSNSGGIKQQKIHFGKKGESK